MHPSHVVWRQAGGHRLYTLALAGQQQAGAVILQRNDSVSMPCGFGQALDICRKAPFLRAWHSSRAHRTILHEIVLL